MNTATRAEDAGAVLDLQRRLAPLGQVIFAHGRGKMGTVCILRHRLAQARCENVYCAHFPKLKERPAIGTLVRGSRTWRGRCIEA